MDAHPAFAPASRLEAAVKVPPAAPAGGIVRTALEHVHATKEEALTRFRALPGVVSVALTGAAPYGPGWGMSNLNGETWGLPGGEPMSVASLHVGPGYFRTVGLPLRAGRPFSTADRARSDSVMLVNEPMRSHL